MLWVGKVLIIAEIANWDFKLVASKFFHDLQTQFPLLAMYYQTNIWR